jgi:hypothetical protein
MPYPGGKGGAGVYQTIINGMPRHEVYVEPFLGGGSVMAAKRPACLNIGVDLDAEVIAQAQARIVGNDDTRSALAGGGDAADSPGEAMQDGTAGSGITAGAIGSDGDNGRYEFYVGDGIAFLLCGAVVAFLALLVPLSPTYLVRVRAPRAPSSR